MERVEAGLPQGQRSRRQTSLVRQRRGKPPPRARGWGGRVRARNGERGAGRLRVQARQRGLSGPQGDASVSRQRGGPAGRVHPPSPRRLGLGAAPAPGHERRLRSGWGGASPRQARAEVRQLVDQAHVRADPATALLDELVHGVEIQMPVLVQAIRDHEGGGPTGAQLAVDQDLLTLGDAGVDQLTQRVQVIEDLGIVVPADVQVFRAGRRRPRCRRRALVARRVFIGRLKGNVRQGRGGFRDGRSGRARRRMPPGTQDRPVAGAIVPEGVGDFLGDVDDDVEVRCFLGGRLEIEIHARVVDLNGAVRVPPLVAAHRLARVEVVLFFGQLVENGTGALVRPRRQRRVGVVQRARPPAAAVMGDGPGQLHAPPGAKGRGEEGGRRLGMAQGMRGRGHHLRDVAGERAVESRRADGQVGGFPPHALRRRDGRRRGRGEMMLGGGFDDRGRSDRRSTRLTRGRHPQGKVFEVPGPTAGRVRAGVVGGAARRLGQVVCRGRRKRLARELLMMVLAGGWHEFRVGQGHGGRGFRGRAGGGVGTRGGIERGDGGGRGGVGRRRGHGRDAFAMFEGQGSSGGIGSDIRGNAQGLDGGVVLLLEMAIGQPPIED